MIIYREKINEIELAIWQIDESLEELKKLSNHHYDVDIENITNEVRKKERLLSRYLLELLLNKPIKITYTEEGKPILDSYHISISHTKNYVAVALSKSKEIGIDIEYKSDRVLRIVEKFMGTDELNALSQENNKVEFALLCWCAKESVYKIINESAVDFTEMKCTIKSREIILSYKDKKYVLEHIKTDNFYMVWG